MMKAGPGARLTNDAWEASDNGFKGFVLNISVMVVWGSLVRSRDGNEETLRIFQAWLK